MVVGAFRFELQRLSRGRDRASNLRAVDNADRWRHSRWPKLRPAVTRLSQREAMCADGYFWRGKVALSAQRSGALTSEPCSVLREVGDDEVAQHPALVLAPGGVEHVAAEDGAERVPVGRPEHAERADHLVHVQGVDVLAEETGRPAAAEDRPQDVESRIGQAGQDARMRDVSARWMFSM